MYIDCHNHSEFSMDASFSVAKMVEAAVKKQLDVFSVTDHCELDRYQEYNTARTIANSVKAISEAKEQFSGQRFKLLCGVEIGQINTNEALAETVIKSHAFDFVLGSVHSLADEKDFCRLNYKDMTDLEIMKLLERYFLELIDLSKCGLIDSVAHVTYPFRYIIKAGRLKDDVTPETFDDLYLEFADQLIESNIALENNTASFMKSDLDYELNRRYLNTYIERGGQYITIGSDAHEPKDVGRGIDDAGRMLKDLRINTGTYFEDRKLCTVKL